MASTDVSAGTSRISVRSAFSRHGAALQTLPPAWASWAETPVAICVSRSS